MSREFDSDVEKSFAEYLVTIGYPKDSIVYEAAFPAKKGESNYRPDFLIVNPTSKQRLAVIEVKGRLPTNTKDLYSQLLSYREIIGSGNIPLFIVIPSETKESLFPFDLFVFDDAGKLVESNFGLLPTFEALSAEEVAERKTDLTKEKTKLSKSFGFITKLLAAILFLFIIADIVGAKYGVKLLTPERMALLGGCVALIVIPYAQRIKGLGIEWEKAHSDE